MAPLAPAAAALLLAGSSWLVLPAKAISEIDASWFVLPAQVSASAIGCDANGTTCVNEDMPIEENKCTIYMAPSSLKQVDSFGVYSTKSYSKRSMILPADSPDVPFIDPAWDTVGFVELWDTYWWGEGKGTSDESSAEAASIADFAPGFSALPNYHPFLHNLYSKVPAKPYDDTLANRTTDPGAGAFSYHTGRDFLAWEEIQAGDELFLDYGYPDYFEETAGFEWFKYVPRYGDYLTAEHIMATSWENIMAVRDMVNDTALEEKLLENVLSTIRITVEEYSPRVASLIPATMSALDRIAKNSHGKKPALSRALAQEMTTTKRSIEWIQENGRCLDNIVPRPSTLFQAGRGAIAQRFIAVGDVVVPVPLLQIMDRESLVVHGADKDEEGYVHGHGTQLLLNYCFGHNESSLLLCPLTNVMMINHCSNRTKECGEDGPNAMFRWDTTWDTKTELWLELTLEEMAEEFGHGLSFEVIATRDILPGDEIFIDYGSSWEDAWEQHLAAWRPPMEERSVSVARLNEEAGPVEIMSGDLRSVSDHPTVSMGCLYLDEFEEEEEGYRQYYWWAKGKEDWSNNRNMNVLWRYDEAGNRVYRPLFFEQAFIESKKMSPSKESWRELSDDQILWMYGEDGSQFVPEAFPYRLGDGVHWPCDVISQENQDEYIVRIYQSKIHESTSWNDNSGPLFLTSYPRKSIRYFTKPYKSDAHLPSAFRHHIEIPDDIFPTYWKNWKNEDDLDTGRRLFSKASMTLVSLLLPMKALLQDLARIV